ncbi:MAG: pyruvate kinase [Candidatus Omnitrophota bacterium]|jgi:pyruvate kinase|nr:MAG: pyruvate kinase [Candidatus Omnitrophota bacterium]
MVKTKIIATLGPASVSQNVLGNMMRAGLDVARINFSHGSYNDKHAAVSLVRRLNQQRRRHIEVLGDLEGYRIRVGKLKSPIELKKGQHLYLAQNDFVGAHQWAPFDYKGDLKAIKKGQCIYIDDGNIELIVKGHSAKQLNTVVVRPGILKERKGVNMPGARLIFSGMTARDKAALEFCIEEKIEYVAQSFVRSAEDMERVRKFLKYRLPKCRLIAKIENREGLKNLDEIIAVSDGIMIARGDLGVSLPIYMVPIFQKEIIKRCRKARKFVITATQMLESMTEHPVPTRAEVSDVANAILDGSGYLMLSAETAVGRYPAKTVQMMNSISRVTEEYMSLRGKA